MLLKKKKKKKAHNKLLKQLLSLLTDGKSQSFNIVLIISVKAGFKVWSLLYQNLAFSIRNK